MSVELVAAIALTGLALVVAFVDMSMSSREHPDEPTTRTTDLPVEDQPA